ncbi:small nuclear ribonucleoprotein polypeptide A [Rhizoctonia solani AG-1 IA]|uniref:U2 small nuclear ribonucleoprotein A' n=1 Tax=Thanatephorus cucumeris (strain AG1-IA) TaxID=983506 RepID=L8X780_THACA|nr:small nuclear ribonucleoprotein polypeptide A [Rhizoctonia solani AG-1 IA]
MKLTPEVLAAAQSYINPLKDRELNLRVGHKIPAIENLGVTHVSHFLSSFIQTIHTAAQDQHDTIDFTDNALTSLSNLPRLHRLHTLLLASNRISHIAPSIATSAPRLRTIVLTNNLITELADLKPLGTLKHLEFLTLLGNPVREKKNYREWVIWTCASSLRVLDFQRIKDKERKSCKALFVTAEGLPTALATSIEEAASAQPTGLTFTPGGEDIKADDRPGQKAGAAGRLMTAEERARVREAIANASSAEEIKRLEPKYAPRRRGHPVPYFNPVSQPHGQNIFLRSVVPSRQLTFNATKATNRPGGSIHGLPIVIGALIGTQTGRDIEIVNTFELVLRGDQNATYDGSALSADAGPKIDHDFLTTRRDQCWFLVLVHQVANIH